MTKKMKGISLALGASLLVSGLAACSSGATEKENPWKLDAYNGGTVDLTPYAYQRYLALTEENEIAKLLFEHNQNGKLKSVIKPQSLALGWESNEGASRYTVIVSDSEEFKNQIVFGTTQELYYVVEDLLPGTYYWKVTDNLGNETDVDSFVVTDYVRSLDVDEIKNFRDLGGWKTESGKKIKYGLSYRCAAIQESSGPALLGLGVKTEIDLRADEEYAVSVIPQKYGLNFLQAGIMQGDYILKDKTYRNSSLTQEQIDEMRHTAVFKQEYADALYNAFKLYTDASNYPIVFHCTSGADRTGTFAFLLEGMLGVEIDDLYKDFELTCFAMGGKRWRSNIEKDDSGNYFFNDDGYVTVSDNYVAIGLLYKGLMADYSTGDGKLSSAIKNYLRTDVGLSDEDFEAIEDLMLE